MPSSLWLQKAPILHPALISFTTQAPETGHTLSPCLSLKEEHSLRGGRVWLLLLGSGTLRVSRGLGETWNLPGLGS